MVISFFTLGCRLNQAEEESLKRRFLSEGYLVASPQEADVCVVNTCSVTALADKKSRLAIKRLQALNKRLRIVVTGCSAEVIQGLSEVYLTIPNSKKEDIFEIINAEWPKKNNNPSKPIPKTRTRALLKVQDGCNNFCSYCIVPFLRGRERSMGVASLIKEAKELENLGYRELVISGVNVGRYGSDMRVTGSDAEDVDLYKLIGQILEETSFSRIRLSSINPQDITDDLINLWQKEPRLCRHFHLSLQSGSDTVLKRMGRPYNTNFYRELVKKIMQKIPDMAITTDVIVGFPEETDNEFEETLDFIKEIGFAKVHIFRYSKREGTKASRMENQIPELLKKERAKRLQEVANKLHNNFVQKCTGTTAEVLFEKTKDGLRPGLTSNYLKVLAPADKFKRNAFVKVKLTNFSPEKDAFIIN